MNRIIVIAEMFFCLLVFSLSNPKAEAPAGSDPGAYQRKRSECLILPSDKINDCLEELNAKPY
jgi:hypothetical protein